MYRRSKIVFVGDSSCGKTSILTRYLNNTFDVSEGTSTIGIDWFTKTEYLDDRAVKLQLWDTAGQERFKALVPSYCKNSSAVVLTYDVTSEETFRSIASWHRWVVAECNTSIHLFLVANKVDLSEQRTVLTLDGEQLAGTLGLTYIETSAKTGQGIKELFRAIASSMPCDDTFGGGPPLLQQGVILDEPKEGCCGM